MLGEFELAVDGVVVDLGTPKERQLLAVLFLGGGTVVPRDRVVDALWPDRPPAKPRSSLRVYVSHLRAAMASAALRKDMLATLDEGYRLQPGAAIVDSARLADAVRVASDSGTPVHRRIELLDAGLGSIRGEPFADMPYAEFTQGEIQRLDELIAAAHELRADLAVESGEPAAWLPQLAGLVARYPFRDRLRAAHMRALAATGRQGEALRSYADHRSRLIEEMGIEPGPELKSLEAELLAIDGAATVEHPLASTSHVTSSPGMSPLLGRDEELGLLRRRFDLASDGEGQIVVVSGEAGVGKTRLAESLVAEVSDRDPTIVRLECSPHHQQTVLHPLRSHLRRRHVAGSPPTPARAAARRLLVDWLHDGERALDLFSPDPDDRRRGLLRAALTDLTTPGGQGPVVCIVEDIQWSDPSTEELLVSLSEAVADTRLLLVVTHRTPGSHAVAERTDATVLRLGGLPRRVTAEIVSRAAGTKLLPGEVVADIAGRANGIPLFAEEMARAVAERGADPAEAVPATLYDSMTARLDRIPGARDVVEAAAVLGTAFDLGALGEVTGRSGVRLADDVEQLCAGGILVPRGSRPEPTYRFRHLLFRDVADDSLADARRVEIHRRIALVLEARDSSPDPARLARHWTGAGDVGRAVSCWLDAARRALSVAALQEATDSAQRGLALAARAEPPETGQDVVELHLLLAAALTQLDGPAADSVTQQHTAVLESELGASRPQQFRALWGRWYGVSTGGEPGPMLTFAEQLLMLSSELDDDEVRIQAHHAMWSSLIIAGRFDEVLHHVESGKRLYRDGRHEHLIHDYGGHDPGVCMWGTGGLARWMLGETEQGARDAGRGVELADRLDHAYSQLEASFGPLTIAALDRDSDRLDALTTDLHGLLDSGQLPASAAGYVDGYRGLADLIRGDAADALGRLEHAAPGWRDLWGCYCFPLDEGLAAAYLVVGDTNAALAEVDAVLDGRPDRAPWWDAEFHRRRAEAFRAAERPGDLAELETATSLARAQGAVVFEVRALIELVATGSADPSSDEARLRELLDLLPVEHDDARRARKLLA